MHITLPRTTFSTFMPNWNRKGSNQLVDVSLRKAIFASALYNCCLVASVNKSGYSANSCRPSQVNLQIADRILDCTSIACCIERKYSLAHQRELTRKFCKAASTSIYCWEYAFLRRQASWNRGYHSSLDVKNHAFLELALLVASGYDFADVKSWMIILGRKGKLRLSKGGLEVWRAGQEFELESIYSCHMPCFA
jgi:hypothetical protein